MFELKSYLSDRGLLVDRALAARLPPETDRPTTLHRAMRYAALTGGKRLRPILCLAASEAVGATLEQAMTPALAVELFHAYTLVHDDLPAMDNDDLRRGKPTCHKAFDEATAILVGDALLTLAFEWLASDPPASPYSAADYVLELATAGGHAGVVAGQAEDLAGEGQEPTADAVDYIHTHKTGDLIRASTRLGGMAGGASSTEMDALERYGKDIGLAFQVTDDLLNATSSSEVLGKAAGSDEARGKTTYVAVYGLEAARARADNLVEDAIQALENLPGTTEPLVALARYVVDRTH